MRLVLVELDGHAEPFRRRSLSHVVEPYCRAPCHYGQIIGMTPVSMYAAEHIGLRPNHVPLLRRDIEAPRFAKELGEDAARVGMWLQPLENDAVE